MSTETITIEDKQFELLISNSAITERCEEMANSIYLLFQKKKALNVICLMKGADAFTTELFKPRHYIHFERFEINRINVEFSSYKGKSELPEFNLIDGDILIIDDILDTGETIRQVIHELKKQQSVKGKHIYVTALLKKQHCPFDLTYTYGFDIPNDFVVGFGMDYNEKGRDLLHIYIEKPLNEKTDI